MNASARLAVRKVRRCAISTLQIRTERFGAWCEVARNLSGGARNLSGARGSSRPSRVTRIKARLLKFWSQTFSPVDPESDPRLDTVDRIHSRGLEGKCNQAET